MTIKNVIIKSINLHTTKALLLSHGGYTPRRDFVRRGSGMVCVPDGLTLHFNCLEDHVSIGTRAIHLIDHGIQFDPIDTKQPGSTINNYSLTYNKKFERLTPTNEYDLITISENGKAHMSDVFRAIQLQNKRYEMIHSVACRIDKINFDWNISMAP